jgi:hypothetical protein
MLRQRTFSSGREDILTAVLRTNEGVSGPRCVFYLSSRERRREILERGHVPTRHAVSSYIVTT